VGDWRQQEARALGPRMSGKCGEAKLRAKKLHQRVCERAEPVNERRTFWLKGRDPLA